jgi:hypothetical protein
MHLRFFFYYLDSNYSVISVLKEVQDRKSYVFVPKYTGDQKFTQMSSMKRETNRVRLRDEDEIQANEKYGLVIIN